MHLSLTLSTSETKRYWRTGNQMLDLFLNLALFKESNFYLALRPWAYLAMTFALQSECFQIIIAGKI